MMVGLLGAEGRVPWRTRDWAACYECMPSCSIACSSCAAAASLIRLGLPLLGLLLRCCSVLILSTQSLTALGEQPTAWAVPLMVLRLWKVAHILMR